MSLVTVSLVLPAASLGRFYAFAASLLGSTASEAIVSGNTDISTYTPSDTAASTLGAGAEAAQAVQASTGAGPVTTGGETDSAGTPYDPARHAGSKGTTKDGLWRMKVGVSRPEHEGKPKEAGASPTTAGASAGPAATAAPVAAEDDEFAAWAAAATPSTPVARSWTDADLSKLCNQAAVAAGGPDKVKALIGEFVPEGAVPHSRSIPADKREAFASKVETTLGIKYEG